MDIANSYAEQKIPVAAYLNFDMDGKYLAIFFVSFY